MHREKRGERGEREENIAKRDDSGQMEHYMARNMETVAVDF